MVINSVRIMFVTVHDVVRRSHQFYRFIFAKFEVCCFNGLPKLSRPQNDWHTLCLGDECLCLSSESLIIKIGPIDVSLKFFELWKSAVCKYYTCFWLIPISNANILKSFPIFFVS